MKKLISFFVSFALILSLSTTVSAAATSDNLVGWWKLDNNAEDSTTNDLDGSSPGSSYVTPGKFGDAYDFNGTDFIEIADNDLLLEPENITVEAWVKREGTPGTYKHIVSKRLPNRPGYSSYGLYTGANGGLSFYVGKTGTFARSAQAEPDLIWDNEWHHVAGIFDGESVKLFVDSEQVAGDIANSEDIYYEGTGNLYIGSYNGTTAYSFNGLVDDVRIWNVALNIDELADEMDDPILGNADYCPNTDSDETVWSEELGTNRWQYFDGDEVWGWYQNKPLKRESGTMPVRVHGLDYTYGCSGKQILELLNPLKGTMQGHWKFGLSTSMLEDFHMNFMNGDIDGRYYIETISVDSRSTAPVSSLALESGVNYILKASGTFTYDAALNWADAEWYLKAGNIVKGDTEGSKPYVLDVSINGYSTNTDWGDYQASHEYTKDITGTGSPLTFSIYDSKNDDNLGSITVDIYADL